MGPTLENLSDGVLRELARRWGAEVDAPGEKVDVIEALDYTAFNPREVEKYTFVCRKCRMPIQWIGEAYVVMSTDTTADGLSYCPPNPDASRHGDHTPLAWTGKRLGEARPAQQ